MNSLPIIREPRKLIKSQTIDQFTQLITLFEIGISLLVDCTNILKDEGSSLSLETAEGASKYATWRFLSTLPISIVWCFDIAQNGDYLISKNLLRLSIEESIKLAYYATHPGQALRQIVQDRDSDEVNLSYMIEELNIEHGKGILNLYGRLSNLYVHANLNLPPEIVYEEKDLAQIGGGSRYIPELFEAIVHQLLILIANALKYVLTRFPVLIENEKWLHNYLMFLEKASLAKPSAGDSSEVSSDNS